MENDIKYFKIYMMEWYSNLSNMCIPSQSAGSNPSCFAFEPTPHWYSWESSGRLPECLGPCHPCVGSGWYPWLQALLWPIPNSCSHLGNEPEDGSTLLLTFSVSGGLTLLKQSKTKNKINNLKCGIVVKFYADPYKHIPCLETVK